MSGRFEAKRVVVPEMRFDAGGGTGLGELSVEFATLDEPSKLALDFDVSSFRRDKIFDVFPVLKSEGAPAIESDDGDARIDLTFDAIGDPLDIYSFSGSGQVRITGSNLNDMNLFGGLSETLSNSAFPVGSLSLRELESPFEIRKESIAFEVIRG